MIDWQDAILAEAHALADKGYRVFPCRPGTKKPATAHGFKDASVDHGEIAAWWEDGPNCNLAIATAGLLIVDFDGAHPWENAPEFAPAVAHRSLTPRGGSHIWFRQPDGVRIGSTKGKLGILNPGDKGVIDTRADGGYVVIPPSRIGAAVYSWPEGYTLPPRSELPIAPGWLLQALADLNRKPTQPAAPPPARPLPAADVERRASEYLAAMPHAIEKQDGHGATFAAASALVHGFALPPEVALAMLLNEYNPRCEPPWSYRELSHKVQSALDTPHDKPRGYLRDAELWPDVLVSDVDLSCFFPKQIAAEPATPRDDDDDDDYTPPPIVEPFPEHLLQVPGLIGEIADYMGDAAHRRQPVLALGAAISVLAVLTGRKITDKHKTRTNLYSVGVCDSGGGKEIPRRVAKEILEAAGCEHMLGPEGIGSASGLIAVTEERPVCLWPLDEIGQILRAIGNAKSAPHLQHITTNLMKLWSSAGSTYKSDAVVDLKRVKTIRDPHVVLWGTTVQRSFYETFTGDALSNGFLARIMVFETNNGEPPFQTGETQPIPMDILEGVTFWREFLAPRAGANLADCYSDPYCVPYNRDALERFDAGLNDAVKAGRKEKRESEERAVLWTRVIEKARKLALLYACSECAEEPIVGLEAANWAIELATHTTRKMIAVARDWSASTSHAAMRKKLLRIIGSRPGGILSTDIGKRFDDVKGKDRQALLDELVGDELLFCEKLDTGGRPKYHYRTTTE